MKTLKYRKTLYNKQNKSFFDKICQQIPTKHKGFTFDSEVKDLDGSVVKIFKRNDDIIAIGNGITSNSITCVSSIEL